MSRLRRLIRRLLRRPTKLKPQPTDDASIYPMF